MVNRQPFHLSIIPTIENASCNEFRFVIGPLLLRTFIPVEGYNEIINAIRARGTTMLWDKGMVTSIITALELAHQVDKDAEDAQRRQESEDAELRRRNTTHHN
jgi:hypothetical protein